MDRVYEHTWLIQAPATIWGREESTGAGEKGGEEGRRKGTPQLSPSCPAAVTCRGPGTASRQARWGRAHRAEGSAQVLVQNYSGFTWEQCSVRAAQTPHHPKPRERQEGKARGRGKPLTPAAHTRGGEREDRAQQGSHNSQVCTVISMHFSSLLTSSKSAVEVLYQ